MTKWIYLILLIVLALQIGYGQNKAVEFTVHLDKNNTRYFSEQIPTQALSSKIDFIGVSAYSLTENQSELSYRVKQGSIWSNWITFNNTEQSKLDQRSAFESEIIFDSFDAIQLSSNSEYKKEIQLRIFYAFEKNNYNLLELKSASCELNTFCDRACWCSDCPIDTSPEFTEPTHVIIHHSAGFTQSNNFASVVEFYWDLHVNTNGWDDIGYNWLIDPNGVIYQGRPDGYQGAHFSCINENTVGICVIGDYTSQAPSSLAQESLVNLLAHECTTHKIDALGSSYHETGEFIINNISGHRDGNDSAQGCTNTACPGNSFYPLFNLIRNRVADLPCYVDAITNTVELTNDITVYPNPCSDYLQILDGATSVHSFQLINSNGTKMHTPSLDNRIDTSTLTPGIYFLIASDRIAKRIIKL